MSHSFPTRRSSVMRLGARWLEISMRWNELDQEICSLARTMSVIGDRWTILILRECFMKVRRFEDFQSRLGISRGVLAERLHGLTDNFILTKVDRKSTRLNSSH